MQKAWQTNQRQRQRRNGDRTPGHLAQWQAKISEGEEAQNQSAGQGPGQPSGKSAERLKGLKIHTAAHTHERSACDEVV